MPTADSLIEAHFTGGFNAFAEHFYRTVNYPAAARESCGIGHLHVRLTLQEGRGLKSIEFLNAFGYGMEQDVGRVLKASVGEWRGHG